MKYQKIKKGIDAIKKIKMAQNEKVALLGRLDSLINKKTVEQQIPSNNTLSYNSHLKVFSLKPKIVYMAVFCLVLFFTGSWIIFNTIEAVPEYALPPTKTTSIKFTESLPPLLKQTK